MRLIFPSFIYSISWEDYNVDKDIMDYNCEDNIITLTGGGCNALNMCLTCATVNCVDMNPAQNHLVDLKKKHVQ